MTIEDIEEIGHDISSDSQTARKSLGTVNIKSFRKTVSNPVESSDVATGNEGFLPGKASVFVKTWGCGHNNSDGEYMAGLLASQGYSVILDQGKSQDADVWLLNSCTVKGPSQQTFVNDIEKGKNAGKKVIVAGCVPQGAPKGSEWNGLSMIGVQQIDQVVGVVEETLKGNTVVLMKEAKTTDSEGVKRKAGGASLNLPKIRRNPFIEIIPINTGCLNQCTYCKTKHARGDLGSYSPEEIISRVNTVLNEGVKEIWLTSEDTGAYGRDIGVTIVELLWGIVDALDKHEVQDAMLRVGMTNPPYILEHLEDIAKILAHPKVYSFLHVPVQAGSTKVLTDMRRLYERQDFEHVVDYLRSHVPGITVATDIICGFPTETEEDFEETMDILRKYKFSVLHISQFYPRPGTPAARMKRLPTKDVKDRSRRATAFFDSYTSYDEFIGSTQKILITEASSDGVNYIGHNKAFHQILVPKDDILMGQTVMVEITNVGKFYLMGKVLESSMEQLRNGVVAPKRIPKLVRVWRGMVTLDKSEDEEEMETDTDPDTENIREDGAQLSLGTASTGVKAHGSTRFFSLIQLLCLLSISVWFVFFAFHEVKITVKLMACVIGFIALEFLSSTSDYKKVE